MVFGFAEILGGFLFIFMFTCKKINACDPFKKNSNRRTSRIEDPRQMDRDVASFSER